MKTPRKLGRHITLYLGGLALVMIAGYSILVEISLLKGLEEAVAFDLRLAARDYEQAYKKDPGSPLPDLPRITACLGETALPDWFKHRYPPPTLGHGKLLVEGVDLGDAGLGECLVLALAHDLPGGKRLYLIKTYTDADDIPGAFKYSENMEILTLSIGIGFILLILVAVRLLFRRVSSSLEILYEWAGGLDRQRLEQPRPSFNFKEIDQLADLIQNAVKDLHQALNREHLFLQNASHELRNPIAVLRSNMDLLERLRPHPENREKAVYQRMERAVDNMHLLTLTLLWLSRKEERMPEAEPVDIGGLVEELVRENQYLLIGKNVALSLDTAGVVIPIPLAAGRIALVNLIRNAFQYTAHGTIDIRVTPGAVTITNTDLAPKTGEPGEEGGGFGLGLNLVEQIARKLNIGYESQVIPGGHKAILHLTIDSNQA